MDGARFDLLARLVARDSSRRGVVRAGLGAVAAGIGAIALRGIDEAAAKRKKNKKVTLCLSGQTIRTGKKRKKKLLRQGATSGACPAATTTTTTTPPPPPCTTTTRAPVPPCSEPDCFERCGVGYRTCSASPLGCCVAGHECCPLNTGVNGCCGIGLQCCPPRNGCGSGYCARVCA